MASALGLLFIATVAVTAHASLTTSPLGPGLGPWPKADPTAQGISPVALDRIAKAVSEALLYRHCLIVVKNGQLVHESYGGGYNASSVHRTQSMGKTTIAALMGVAVGKGLLDIDTPLHEYGVRSNANWSRNPGRIDYYPNVTTRHLLGQSSGYGKVPPGSMYTYDSYEYIQHMSYMLEAISKEAPVEFATREFVDKLGMAHDHFAYDGAIYDIGGNISVSGGQMITCLDAARVGQLIINEGKWLDAAGREVQLIPEDYAKQIVKPSFRQRIGYGLLTWLNTHNYDDDAHANPSPRWGNHYECSAHNQTCGLCCLNEAGKVPSSAHCDLFSDVISEGAEHSNVDMSNPRWLLRGSSMGIDSSVLDDNTPKNYKYKRAPYDAAMAQGEWGQYIMMVPSEKLVIVSMGNSGGVSNDCWHGYNEGFTNALLWNVLAPVLNREVQEDGSGASAPVHGEKRNAQPLVEFSVNYSQPSSAHPSMDVVGSCMCDCPVNTGFGLCFNVDASMGIGGRTPSDCNATLSPDSRVRTMISYGARQVCPPQGRTLQCDKGQNESRCGAHGFITKRNEDNEMSCKQSKPCGPLPNMPEDYEVETCECGLRESGFSPCIWHSKPCSFGSYYPTWQMSLQEVMV